MKRYGMFKALICSENEEYNYPFIPEKCFFVKVGSIILLSFILAYLLINPPINPPGIIHLKSDFKIGDRVDKFGMTRLHKAVIYGKNKIVKLLVRNGCDPNATDNYGWSPLHWAKFLGRDDLCDILTEGGAREDIRSTSDWFVFRKGSLPGDLKGRYYSPED